ncbi:MAG: 50S ribosomal protein L13 [Candidatus Anstonellales archaeon]
MLREKLTIDAKNTILGRLASKVAKYLLLGREVFIVNAEQALISGSLQKAKEKYLKRLTQKHKADPSRSPKWPKEAHRLLKRIIRGMLPKKTSRGKSALKRLKVFMGIPKELENEKFLTFSEFLGLSKRKTFSLLDLCREIGYKK